MNLKNFTNLNADALNRALDDLISIVVAIFPTLTPEAQAAVGTLEIGDEVWNALEPVILPAKPAPAAIVQPAAQPKPVTLADRIIAAKAAA